MRVIHVARKPLSEGNVASNVLKHGTGAINIDASRILAGEQPSPTTAPGWDSYNKTNAEQGYRDKDYNQGDAAYTPSQLGRWPPNVVLQHKPGCRCVGTKEVKGSHDTTGVWGSKSNAAIYSNQGWHDPEQQRHSYTSPDGKEAVASCECELDCPVAIVDAQSVEGGMHSAGGARQKVVTGSVNATCYNMGGPRKMPRFGDAGGASRFFKHVQDSDE